MTLDEIDLARVHITLPDSSVFRRDYARPKASVALFLRDGQSLSAESIRGIQRLVAASVPELSPADVSVLDASGAPASASSGEIDDPGLQLKQAIERNYERKITALIASVVGDGHASVSVEAAINTDQVRATHESTLTRPSSGDNGSASVPLPAARSMPETGRPPLPSAQGLSNGPREEARTVRDLEQVIKSPGAVRRLSVGIVFDRALPQGQLTQLTAVVSTAIGLDAARGDVLSTFVRDGKETPSGINADERTIRESVSVPPVEAPFAASSVGSTRASWPFAAMLVVPALLLVLLVWGFKKCAAPASRLSEAQRDQHLARLRSLLAIEEPARD
jgi:flagellar M-ring protein FliF